MPVNTKQNNKFENLKMSPFENSKIESLKNRIRKYLFISSLALLFIILPLQAFVQESKVSLNGYVKELYMFYSPEILIPGTDLDYLATNIIHNRLNFKWYASKKNHHGNRNA